MLGDTELEDLEDQLNRFGLQNGEHHDNLEKLLQKYQNLLEDYRGLKSDYEEEKVSREKYKKLARGQERNPFVLVLVDGDGYVFKDQFIKAGSEGGVLAAQALNDSIQELLPTLRNGVEQCRVMVRIYANLAGLSRVLARAGYTGNEARSFAPFTASFNRSQDLFDFIDAADKKEGADFKIREMFRLFADSSQCKHIYFAGCHDTGYLSLLTPYQGRTDRISLVKAAAFSPEYNSLDLPIVELPSAFRSTLFNTYNITLTTKHVSKPKTDEPVCKFFQKGDCRFGNQCKNAHILPSGQKAKPENERSEFRWPSPSPQGSMNRQELTNHSNGYSERDWSSVIYSPRSAAQGGLIPVNKDGERLDPPLIKPTIEAWNLYNSRAERHKLCNNHHLKGSCQDLNCGFDHSPLAPEAIHVMRYILKEYPCPRKGSCRLIKCVNGHICWREGCKGQKPCKLNANMHHVDLRVAEYQSATDLNEIEDPDFSEGSREDGVSLTES